MSDKQPTKRTVKKTESLRDKAAKTIDSRPKRRVLKATASGIGKPLKVLKPLAKPFQAKPVRKSASFAGRILWPKYLRNAIAELRQVIWPSRSETRKLTTAVFVFALCFGFIIAITDYGLDKLFKKIILK